MHNEQPPLPQEHLDREQGPLCRALKKLVRPAVFALMGILATDSMEAAGEKGPKTERPVAVLKDGGPAAENPEHLKDIRPTTPEIVAEAEEKARLISEVKKALGSNTGDRFAILETRRLQRANKRAASETSFPPGNAAVEEEMFSPMYASDFYLAVNSREVLLSGSEIISLLDNTLPRGWGRGDVATITQRAEMLSMPPGYGKKAGGKGVGVAMAVATSRENEGEKGGMIEFSRHAAAGSSVERILEDALFHEIAHLNDWENDKDTSFEERVDLVLKIAERLKSEDRYRSPYLERIENENKEEELYLRAKEYWAEIASQYFRDPNKLNAKDAEIVAGHIERTDPEFDVKMKSLERQGMIREMIRRQGRVAAF